MPVQHLAGRAPAASADAPHTPILPGLQLLRGLAALAVAWVHISNQAGILVGLDAGPAYYWLRPFPFEAGVDVFFVISGFVMVWSSRPLFGRAGASLVFAGRRLSRVVPLYWLTTAMLLGTTLALPAAVSEPAPSAALVVTSFLFLPWRRPDGLIQPLFSLGWTLNYEMLFYAVFTLFVPLRARVAVPCVIGVVCGLVLLGWLFQPTAVMLRFWTDPIITEFAAGAALGMLARRVHLPGAVRIALVGFGVVGLWAADRSGWQHSLVFTAPCVALVAAAALGRPARAPMVGTRWAIRFGDMSYALYLMHPFPMRFLALVWSRMGLTGTTAGVMLYVAAAVASSLVVAWLVHVFIERRLTRAARRLWPSERALAF